MRHFPSAADMQLGRDLSGPTKSGGKRRTGTLREGNRYLRGALVGQTVRSTKGTALALLPQQNN